MTDEDILFAVVGWLVMLGAAFWYSNKKRHPTRSPLSAFGIFCGIFGGISLAGIAVAVSIWDGLGLSEREVPGTVAGVLALTVVIPAWHLAVARISRSRKQAG